MTTELFEPTLVFRGLSDEDTEDGDVGALTDDDADELDEDEDDDADGAAVPEKEGAPDDGNLEE